MGLIAPAEAGGVDEVEVEVELDADFADAMPEPTPTPTLDADEVATEVEDAAFVSEAERDGLVLEGETPGRADDALGFDAPEPWALRDEIAEEYREFEGRDPTDLFGLPDGASPPTVRERYRELCRRYAPDRFEHPALAPVAEMAAELLHATAVGYEALRGRTSVDTGTEAPTPTTDDRDEAAAPSPDRSADAAELPPDPRRMAGQYARHARERMASGNFAAATGLLTLALRSDPGNRACRIELAYARFRERPECAGESLEELEGLLHAAPKNVLARLYAAEMSHAVDDFDRAADHFRAGCELWERERA